MANVFSGKKTYHYIRKPAVAGSFYPDDSESLKNSIKQCLSDANNTLPVIPQSLPKALIVPHAGYQYSGITAAKAYCALTPFKQQIKRVVLMGPCHRIGTSKIALTSSQAFETPLGLVPIDQAAQQIIVGLDQVDINDETHQNDHSLEVQLPFLQMILDNFSILPMIVGNVSANEVAEVIEKFWEDLGTLILISSDLSHNLEYNEAQIADDRTRHLIEELSTQKLGNQQACGSNSINGLVMLARDKELNVKTMDIRNSGDTAGDKSKVVGYGSWIFFEAKHQNKNLGDLSNASKYTKEIVDTYGETLLVLAARSILKQFSKTHSFKLELSTFPSILQKKGASFITLKKNGRLRGCIGTLRATHPLAKDVVYNAHNAAFHDSRFQKLTEEELFNDEISIGISLLSPLVEVTFDNEKSLEQQLRPKTDGLVLSEGQNRGVFLPAVWDDISDPKSFIAQLKRKAGFQQNYWSNDLKAWRFVTFSISSKDLPEQLNLWLSN